MLLKKINHEPFTTEIPMEDWDDIAPAPPLDNLKARNIAVITTSGVVPWGNPDRFKTYRNTHWRKYNIAELKELEPGKWEAVHGGYNVAYMNKNPHYGVPLDALRSLEADGVIGAGKFGSMYLAQVPRTPGVHLAGIADLSPANARANLARVGWEPARTEAASLDAAIKAGTVSINGFSEGDITTPFGGYKHSGFGGRDNGLEAFEQYQQTKTIWYVN